MKCDELKPIELECNMGKDINGVEHREPWKAYDIDEVDAAIEELKDKCQMHDFFWEGCGFAKRGFKNTIAVSEAFDKLEAENAELKQKLEDVNELIKTARQMLEDAKATHYAEMVDAGMKNRKLQDELTKLKAQMPEYKQFIEDEDFKKKLVDEYAGYVYEWAGHRYVATPYINVFIKGILRTLYKALANWADAVAFEETEGIGYDNSVAERWRKMESKCLKKAEEYK